MLVNNRLPFHLKYAPRSVSPQPTLSRRDRPPIAATDVSTSAASATSIASVRLQRLN